MDEPIKEELKEPIPELAKVEAPQVAAPAPTAPPANMIDINKLFLPGAILLASILISGTLLYTRASNLGTPNSGAETASILSADNFKKWAKSAGVANVSEFASCMASETYKDEVNKDYTDGTALGVNGTPAFFINGTQVIGAQPYDAFKTAIDQALAGKKGLAAASADDDPVLGNPNAPVTMIEFSDFQCPYCRRFWEQTLPEIKKQYIDTGKVKFVYRDFPLSSIHPGAFPAAIAAECAKAQGRYWEMHDEIFGQQI